MAGGHFGPQLQVVERGLVLHGGLNAGKPKRPKKKWGKPMPIVPKQKSTGECHSKKSESPIFCDNLKLFYLFGGCYNYRRLQKLGEGCTSAFRGSPHARLTHPFQSKMISALLHVPTTLNSTTSSS